VLAPAKYPDLHEAPYLDLIAQGDVNAMAHLYDAHSRIVYSVALRILRDPSAAEDVLQDVFLRIWRTPSSFVAARGSLGGWLAVIARNRAIDVLRTKKPTDSIDDVPLPSKINLIEDVQQSLLVARLRPRIARLPSAQREALDMAFFRGMTHAEIAEATQSPLGTVKSRIRSALLKIGKAIHG